MVDFVLPIWQPWVESLTQFAINIITYKLNQKREITLTQKLCQWVYLETKFGRRRWLYSWQYHSFFSLFFFHFRFRTPIASEPYFAEWLLLTDVLIVLDVCQSVAIRSCLNQTSGSNLFLQLVYNARTSAKLLFKSTCGAIPLEFPTFCFQVKTCVAKIVKANLHGNSQRISLQKLTATTERRNSAPWIAHVSSASWIEQLAVSINKSSMHTAYTILYIVSHYCESPRFFNCTLSSMLLVFPKQR